MGRALWPFVGISKEVGWRIAQRFSRDVAHANECTVPVWPRRPRPRPATLKDRLAHLVQDIDAVLTEPKRKGYFTRRRFRDFGAPDIAGLGWEEYLWQEQPFGFHIQGVSQGKRVVSQSFLAGILQGFMPLESAQRQALAGEAA
jgi:hypothetical protein